MLWLHERIVRNPRTTGIGLLVLALAGLLALGAHAITALTDEVNALTGLVQALGNGWQALVSLPVAAYFLLGKDRA